MIQWLKRLLGYGDIFDLERVDVPLAEKEDHLEWMKRGVGYFDGSIQEIRKFYLIFTLESGESYRLNDPCLIERDISSSGGFINIVWSLVTARKECFVVEFKVYDKDDNFLVTRPVTVIMNRWDSLNFTYRMMA